MWSDLVPIAVYTCDTEGVIQEFNRRAVELWGREPERGARHEKFCGSFKIYYPDGSPMPHEECPMARVLRGEEIKAGAAEILVERPDGSFANVLSAPQALKNERGEIVGAINCLYDITERKRAEQERETLLQREQAARVEAEERRKESARLATVNRELVSTLSFEDVARIICRAARELTDADGATFILREGEEVYYADENSVSPLWKGRRFPISRCISGMAMLERQAIVIEDIYKDPRFPFDAYRPTFVKSLAMMPVGHDAPNAAIGVYWAETRHATGVELGLLRSLAAAANLALSRAKSFEDLQRAHHELEQASRLKDEFLATLSHELRTPLTAIAGWAEILVGGRLDEQSARRAVEVIRRNARMQRQLIEDVLDVSRIITGKLRLEAREVELPKLIEAAVSTVRLAAEAKGISVEILNDELDCIVIGDPTRLQQVVWNLVSNAVKFTPAGGRVTVRCGREDDSVLLRVSDTGAGISPEFLPHVFERFRQQDGTTTRRHGGLGLGLAIVRHLVELHGGMIKAESEGEGKGATFTVRLPSHFAANGDGHSARVVIGDGEANGDHHDEMADAPLAGLRALVVDDERDAREFLAFVLRQAGAHVTLAESASEAVARVRERAPDVLISDIGMPNADGYALIKNLRAVEKELAISPIPTIALTAYARDEDRVQVLDAGFLKHLSKPVSADDLIAAVAELTARVERV